MAARKAEASAVTKEGRRPLHAAAESGYIAVAEPLAERKEEASAATKDGVRPLHAVAAMQLRSLGI